MQRVLPPSELEYLELRQILQGDLEREGLKVEVRPAKDSEIVVVLGSYQSPGTASF